MVDGPRVLRSDFCGQSASEIFPAWPTAIAKCHIRQGRPGQSQGRAVCPHRNANGTGLGPTR